MPELLFEGYTVNEIFALPDEHFRTLILTDEVLVFRVGSAEVLGKFKTTSDTLILELAQIDHGGEGVLRGMAALASRSAKRADLSFIKWRVHAIHCANPNLRRMLELKGFAIRAVEDVGECYWLQVPVQQKQPEA